MKEDKECFVLKRDQPSLGIGKIKNRLVIQDSDKGKKVYLTIEWVSKPDDYEGKLSVVAAEEVSYL